VKSNSNQRPLAFVTGASVGLGRAFAQRLAQDGYDLALVARNREQLEDLAATLRQARGVNAEVFAADLAQRASLGPLEAYLAGTDSLELLVNNAGFGGYQPFAQLDADIAEQLISVQVLAVTRLTRAALPGMLQRGHGNIINVSSRLAFSGPITGDRLPKRATYAGTKAFINTFTQALAGELAGTGVRVQALCPAVVRTEFHRRMGMDPDRFPQEIVSKPEDVVQASLAGLELGEVICMPGMEDASLLTRLENDQRELFERSGAGAVASRYTR
jgi:short-subunit dehydrogenase